MKLKYILENNIYEDLNLVKFKYANFGKDPNPQVKVLDFEYPGQKGQKTYGERKDLLGFNINYFKNAKYAKKAIDEIDSFARMLSANKDEKYRRLKYFYPEIAEFIRRYNREHISSMKLKKKIFWRNTNYDKLIKQDKENF